MPLANLIYKRTSVDNVTWTPIVAVMDCNNVVLHNIGAVSVKLRTDQNDPTTEKPLAAGSQEVVMPPTRQPYGADTIRFPSGVTIVFVQASSSTSTIVGSFIS